MPWPMFTSYALGGPRDNVKISAPFSWDGMVRSPTPGHAITYYRGRYQWDLCAERWVWHPSDKQITRYELARNK